MNNITPTQYSNSLPSRGDGEHVNGEVNRRKRPLDVITTTIEGTDGSAQPLTKRVKTDLNVSPNINSAIGILSQIVAAAKRDRYEGDFVDGKANGKGILTFADGHRYGGDFVDGKRTGKGVYTWANGNRYEGDFVADKTNGKGIQTWANGERYEGDFVDDKRTGKGILTNANGERYEGDFLDGDVVYEAELL